MGGIILPDNLSSQTKAKPSEESNLDAKLLFLDPCGTIEAKGNHKATRRKGQTYTRIYKTPSMG